VVLLPEEDIVSLRTAGIIALISGSAILLAGDFWQEKQPSDWTDKEVQKLQTKSPWAKDVVLPSAGGGAGQTGSPDLSAPIMGSSPTAGGLPRMSQAEAGADLDRGAMGRPAGREGAGGANFALGKVVVRWESAAPLRDAATRSGSAKNAKKVAEWVQGFYVVTVSGLPSGRSGAGVGMAGADSERTDRMKAATALKIKGKGALPPARIETSATPEGRSISFLFPRAAALSLDDKEVVFETVVGPSQIKVKFSLKDMLYHGKLEL
jgi:hypothetical protein